MDKIGLDELDRKYLKAVIDKYRGGPVGVETLAASISEDATSLEDVVEPFLLQLGFIDRTPRGRCVTQLGYRHLDIPFPRPNNGLEQSTLFS